ncbi:MAG: PKD domain-containing protein [Brumimicrobium sp.]|nr:PKD domain-containing protein [Brumimicrobium sp.]
MKTIITTLLFSVIFLTGGPLALAQNCVADVNITPTGNPGEVFIEDLSITANTGPDVYSGVYILSLPSYDYYDYVNLQPNSLTATYQFSDNGDYYMVFEVYDSLANCYDSIAQTLSINNLPYNCSATYAYYDTVNGQQYFVPDNYDSNLEYHWTFGDGTSSNDPYPYHTYASAGTYTVCLTILDIATNGQTCSDTVCQTIVVNSTSLPCYAGFTSYDTINGQEYFVPDNYNSNYDYYWSFGDGNSSTDPFPYHTYASPGIYTVCLTVIDNINNCGDTLCQNITITNSPCDASFIHYDTLNQNFFIPNTYDQNLSYYWEFGDGSYSYDIYGQHSYASPGTYTACLTIWDNATGCSDTVCQNITITSNNTQCDALFYLFQDSVNISQYYAWNLSVGNNLDYLWDFGDGTTSNAQFPVHTYTTPGLYQICLSINDPNGNCSDIFCDSIEVLNKATGTTINVLPFGSYGQTASITENDISKTEVKLFPNPASDKIQVLINNSGYASYTYAVIDVTGKMVSQGAFTADNENVQVPLNIASLRTGVYFVKLVNESSGDGLQTLKFIKK